METNQNQVEVLFNQAIQYTPEQRAAFLNGACGQDADLRQKVDTLIRAHDDADQFLPEAPTLADQRPLSEQPGTVIDRYKLLQKVGEGGMGVVFMAEQTEPVRRKVALKIIKLGMDTKSVVARFEAERQALALMDHPNIAKVLDAGSTETGRPYFVMELVKGVPINTYCDKNHLSTRERLELFILVCKSIQHAHQKGVIHRDIKPGNILVTLHDGKPVPKVIDFGIAKATNQRLTEKTLFTNFAQMIGTPAYMSPEQAEMSGLDVDTRSDVYSLGVLLYELLTGTTPFPEKELLSKGYGEMQRIIAEQEPDRPSLRMSTLVGEQQTIVAKNRSGEWGHLTRQLRGDLDWIVLKTLEKDRTRRYETANGLAEDIRRHLSDEPVLAAKPSFRYQLAKLYYRHRPTFAAAAGIAAALVIGTVVSTAQAISAKNARDAETEQKIIAEEKQKEAEEAKSKADDQRLKAEQNELQARRLLYAADMRDVGREVDEENFGQAKRLMERQAPYKKLQGWEWRHLWLKTQGTKRKILFEGRNLHPHSLSISADGRFLAVGSGALGGWNALYVWDLNSGQRLASAPEVLQGRVRTAFAPNSNLLAYNSEESAVGSRIHLWHADKGELVASFDIAGTCEGIAFSPDGKTLIVANESKNKDEESRIILWDVTTKQEVSSVPAPGLHVILSLWESFAIDRSGEYAVYAAGRTARVVNLKTGKQLQSLPTGGSITGLAISPDASLAIVASGYGYAENRGPDLWDLSSGERLGTLKGHSQGVSEIVFWPDGKQLATSSVDQTVRLWDISDPSAPKQSRVFKGHQSWVSQLVLAPDQKTLISGAIGEVIAWDTEIENATISELHLESMEEHAWAFAQGGEALVGVEADGVVLRTGPTFDHRVLMIEKDALFQEPHYTFSENGSYLAVGSKDGQMMLWDLVNGQSYRRKIGKGGTRAVLVENDGTVVLVAYDEGNNQLSKLETHDFIRSKVLKSTQLQHGMQPFAAESHDGNFFVQTNGSSDLGALFVSRENEVESSRLITDAYVWTRACFSPNGALLAMRSHAQQIQGAVHVYDTATLEEKTVFASFVPTSGWSLLAFSADSRRFVTGGGDRGLHLWDVDTGQPLASLGTDLKGLSFAAFSPDGEWLGCSTNTGLHLWRAPTRAEIEQTENLALN